MFLDPKPSAKEITDYYKKNFVYSAGEANESQIRTRARKIMHRLSDLNPAGETLLDIGSGYGFFADEAQKLEGSTAENDIGSVSR